jgi:hypothetical protein
MEKRADHVRADVAVADHGNCVIRVAGRSRPDANCRRKQCHKKRGDPPATHPAQLPNPAGKFTNAEGGSVSDCVEM